MPEDLKPPNWPLPDEMLVELGRISALWSALEAHLEVSLGKLAGYDELGDARPFIVLKHTSFPQRLDMLSALCETLASEFPHLAGYKDVVASLRAVQGERNRVIHNGIAPKEDNSGFVLLVATARGKVKRTMEPIAPSDLYGISQRIHVALLGLHALVTRAEYPPIWNRAGT